MSRGFVREGDQEEVPMVPKRAYLPEGVEFCYSGRDGTAIAEKHQLVSERDNVVAINENERRIEVNFINAKLQLLESRIADARLIDPVGQSPDEIRFGATITLKIATTGKIRIFQIVGVDEADISKGKISFISPLARVLMNRKAGDKVALNREKGESVFEVVKIEYR